MKLASVSLFLPTFDVSHAGGLYVFKHLSWLAQHHDVRLLTPGTETNRAAMTAGGVPGVASHCWPIRTPTGLVGRSANYVRWVAAGLSPGVSEYEGLLRDRTTLATLANADLIELHFTPCLAWIDAIRSTAPKVPVVVICHDIESQGTLSRARNAASLRLRLQERIRYPRVRRQEVRWVNRTDLALAFSEKDASRLLDLGVQVTVADISPFVELSDLSSNATRSLDTDRGASRHGSHRVLFVAAFDRSSNEEGAWWLLQHVWPQICAKHPQVELRLVGAHPSQRLRGAAGPGVVVTGFLENLEEEYRSASLAVAPLKTGAGIKFKVLQAMAYGLPVVSTTIGAEGIDQPPDPRVLQVADDAGAFAKAIEDALALARNPEVSACARLFVEERYRFATSMQRITERYEQLARTEGEREVARP